MMPIFQELSTTLLQTSSNNADPEFPITIRSLYVEDDCGIVLENVVKEHTENEESTKIGLSNNQKDDGQDVRRVPNRRKRQFFWKTVNRRSITGV